MVGTQHGTRNILTHEFPIFFSDSVNTYICLLQDEIEDVEQDTRHEQLNTRMESAVWQGRSSSVRNDRSIKLPGFGFPCAHDSNAVRSTVNGLCEGLVLRAPAFPPNV